jgi:hypothetical protein
LGKIVVEKHISVHGETVFQADSPSSVTTLVRLVDFSSDLLAFSSWEATSGNLEDFIFLFDKRPPLNFCTIARRRLIRSDRLLAAFSPIVVAQTVRDSLWQWTTTTLANSKISFYWA